MQLYYPYYGYTTDYKKTPITFPPQHQPVQPGIESLMQPRPIFNNPEYKGSNKLRGKTAIITGGDSGIGRAVSVAFAKEGANVVIVYLYEHSDAEETKRYVEELGRKCLTIAGDIAKEEFCAEVVQRAMDEFGTIDILVNNAGVQFPQPSIECITKEQLELTFRTNIFAMFFLTKAALPHMRRGSAIINTASVTAYQGNKDLIDYSSTKGAIVTFTRSLSLSLIDRGIRVNAVAPGPIWTPLIVSSFSADKVERFGLETPMKRAGQPAELAPTYVYLASEQESSYVTGQVLHVNGGTMVES